MEWIQIRVRIQLWDRQALDADPDPGDGIHNHNNALYYGSNVNWHLIGLLQ